VDDGAGAGIDLDVGCAGALSCELPVVAAERRSLDAAARGPLHTATVAAMPHRTLAAITPPTRFFISSLSCRQM
jgi:hypothetical protein